MFSTPEECINELLRCGRSQPLAILCFIILAKLATFDFSPPPLVISVPLSRLDDSHFGRMGRLPAECLDFGYIQAVTTVVTRPVGYVANEIARTIERVEQYLDHRQIFDFDARTNIISLSDDATMQYYIYG